MGYIERKEANCYAAAPRGSRGTPAPAPKVPGWNMVIQGDMLEEDPFAPGYVRNKDEWAKVVLSTGGGTGGESGGGTGGGVTSYTLLTDKPIINGVTVAGNMTAEDLGLAEAGDIPTKISDLTNDSGFITKDVSMLTNYTTTTGMNSRIAEALADAGSLKYEIVSSLPATGDSDKLYLLAKTTAGDRNIYDEYGFINNAWERLGDTDVDLSGYATTEALANKVDKESGKGLSENDFTATDKRKLDGIEIGAEVNVQPDWNQTDENAKNYIQNKPDIPEGSAVDTALSSTSGNAVQNKVITAALETKVPKETGKGLSANDFTAAYKAKLDGIAAGAEVNVQANWTQTNTSAKDFIQNKPALSGVATSGNYSDLNGKPILAEVATSGSYLDLIDKPSAPVPYTLPMATATTLGGVRPKLKTDETLEVAIDTSGKLWTKEPEVSQRVEALTITLEASQWMGTAYYYTDPTHITESLSIVDSGPDAASADAAANAGVYLSMVNSPAMAPGTLTFNATTQPTTDITIVLLLIY